MSRDDYELCEACTEGLGTPVYHPPVTVCTEQMGQGIAYDYQLANTP